MPNVAQVESEDVVFTLETIVEKFGEEMAPFAVGLCQHLTQAFWRLQVMPALAADIPAPACKGQTTIGFHCVMHQLWQWASVHTGCLCGGSEVCSYDCRVLISLQCMQRFAVQQ